MVERFVEDGALDAADVASAQDLLEEAGVVVLRGAVPATAIGRARVEVAARVASVRRALEGRAKEALDPEIFSFAEVCGRGQGRLDVMVEAWPLDQEGRSGDDEETPSPLWLEVVRRALGDDCRMMACGVVVAAPGTRCQRWHTDGSHQLFPETGYCDLPAHALTVFVPLVDVTPANGPTEFLPTTHKGSRAVLGGDDLLLGSRPTAAPSLACGDVAVFDYRIVHRGGANTTTGSFQADRPVLYAAFGRSWFHDDYNFPSTRSVFKTDEEGEEEERLVCPLERVAFRRRRDGSLRREAEFDDARPLSGGFSGLRYGSLRGRAAAERLASEAGFEWVDAASFGLVRHLREATLLVPPAPLNLDRWSTPTQAVALAQRTTAPVFVAGVRGAGFLGLFADADLEPDAFITEYAGLVTPQLASSSASFDAYAFTYAATLNDESLALSAWRYGNAGRFVNHASGPATNADFVRCADGHGVLRVAVVATRPIRRGDQILVDYGPSYWRASPFPPLDLAGSSEEEEEL